MKNDLENTRSVTCQQNQTLMKFKDDLARLYNENAIIRKENVIYYINI